MSQLCHIVLLGELSVQQDQRRITRFRTQKAGALLAFLAYHPARTHPREHLLELLWPQLNPAAERSNLSFVLSSLRNQLEPPGVSAGSVLVADRNSVRINPASVTTDVAVFEAGLKAAEEVRDEAHRIQQMDSTLSLYRGPLLAGFYEDWIAPERQRLVDRYVNAARQLMRSLAQAGELTRAIDQAQRGIGIDPLREALHCDLMRLYVASGQVPRALQQYAVMERTLLQELGEKPSAAARELIREIRSRGQQAKTHPLPEYDRRAATTPSQETGTPSAEEADSRLPDCALVPSAATVTRTPFRRVAEPPVAPRGTVTLLMAQVRSVAGLWESKISGGIEPQTGEPTPQPADANIRSQANVAQHTARGGADVMRQTLTRASALVRRELARHGGHAFERSRHGQGMAFQSVGEALTCAIAVQRNLAAAIRSEEIGTAGLCLVLHIGDIEPGAQGYAGRTLEQARRLLEAGHSGQILCSEAAAALLRRDLQPDERLVDLGLFRLRDMPAAEQIFEVDYPGKIPQVCPSLLAEAGYTARLPLPLTRFFGRDKLVTDLQSLLLNEATRLVTLTGTGGIGKTRLSIEVARRLVDTFGNAVWFVPLADVRADTGLLSALVDALGLPRSSRVEPFEQVRELLSRQRSLLVLDNFEHLVDAEAATIGLLLERVEALTCLVTSRQRLELGGEHEVIVPALPVPEEGVVTEPRLTTGLQHPARAPQSVTPSQGRDATASSLAVTRHPNPHTLLAVPSVALFVDQAQAVKPDFQLTAGNAEAVARLCDRLEGIPLAVELAASRAQVLNPAQMLSQLQNRFALLVSRRRDVAQRHRTLRAAIDWSYQLLSTELQGFFARLSVFRGGWSLEAAEVVCQEELALDYLAQLRECSLIVTEDSGEAVRYRMLETLREYAFEQINAEEQSALRQQHLEYFLALAEEAEPKLAGADQTEWLTRLEEEHENLRAGLDWSLNRWSLNREERVPIYPPSLVPHPSVSAGLRLCGALPQFWWTRGHLSEGREWCVRFLEKTEGQERRLERAKVLNGVGVLASHQGDNASARAYFEEGLTIKRELGDQRGIASSLTNLGIVAHSQGGYASARAYHLESLDIRREIGDRSGIATSLNNLAVVADFQGDYCAAQAYYQESLILREEIGGRGGIAYSLEGLAGLAAKKRRPEQAAALWGAAEALREAIGSPLPPGSREAYNRAVDEVRQTLGAEAFSAARETGRAMPLEQAVAYALEV